MRSLFFQNNGLAVDCVIVFCLTGRSPLWNLKSWNDAGQNGSPPALSVGIDMSIRRYGNNFFFL
jgi:hypothetical protein